MQIIKKNKKTIFIISLVLFGCMVGSFSSYHYNKLNFTTLASYKEEQIEQEKENYVILKSEKPKLRTTSSFLLAEQESFILTADERAIQIKEAKEEKNRQWLAVLNISNPPTERRVEKIEISDSERDLLERLVEAEAGSESYEGKVAVATVVLNRVENETFPNSITSVIHQKNQFSPVFHGTIKNPASEESKRAVSDVIDNGYRSFDNEVSYFYNPAISKSTWFSNNLVFVVAIGNHHFYK